MKKKQRKKPLCFLVAGEPSGDLLGARLIERLGKACVIKGVGGPLMRRAGMDDVLFKGEELAVMGFLQVLPHVYRLLSRLNETARAIVAASPDVVVTIDSPSFNMRLAKRIRRLQGDEPLRLVHYVAPSVWAWKRGRASKMANLYDVLLTLLPFEAPYFTAHGLETHYVGHPAAWRENRGDGQSQSRSQSRDQVRQKYNVKDGEFMVALLVGSRRQEIKSNGKKMLAAMALMGESLVKKGKAPVTALVVAAPQMKKRLDFLSQAKKMEGIKNIFVVGQAQKEEVFASADMALAVSGTVSVELAAANLPHVIMYDGDKLTEWILSKMLYVRYASLVNIMADEAIIPEYLFSNCKAETIASAAMNLLLDEKKRKSQCDKMNVQLDKMIVQKGEHPSERTARTIIRLFDDVRHEG